MKTDIGYKIVTETELGLPRRKNNSTITQHHRATKQQEHAEVVRVLGKENDESH